MRSQRSQATTKLYYLIWLEGQGDTHVKVVDKETWDWIHSGYHPPKPGDYSYEDKACPPSVLERYRKQEGNEEEPFPNVTSGSCDNDRALLAPGLYVGDQHLDDYTGKSEALDDVEHWKKVLGVKKFADMYEGYIY